MSVRDAVNKELEVQRNQGVIGSGLNAIVDLYLDHENLALLQHFQDELHFVFITSDAKIHAEAQTDPEAVPTDLAGVKVKNNRSYCR